MGVWQWLREYIEYITTNPSDVTDEFYKAYGEKDRLVQILQLAEEGAHWMLTPPHLITLVHAVQQPIGKPEFTRLEMQYDPKSASELSKSLETEFETNFRDNPNAHDKLDVIISRRQLGSTDAYLIGGLKVHGASTAKVDLRAKWCDDIDDPSEMLNRPDPTHCDKPGWPKCYGVGFVPRMG